MTLTLLALFMLPSLFKAVLDPKGTHRAIKDWGNSEGMQFFASMSLLGFALLILISSPFSLSWGWESLLTYLALLTVLKALFMLAPGMVAWQVKLMTEERTPIMGFLGLLFALFLVYIDSQVL